ncbi:hypothetical protein, partial [Gracilinema caldarium]|uniref:hypothetical protein n=1 Tax=Gracilinema caldarium TaxID=215591 RepID=UPI0026F23044
YNLHLNIKFGLRGFEPEQARREGGGKRSGWARQPAETGWKELAGSKVLEAKSSQPEFREELPKYGSSFF